MATGTEGGPAPAGGSPKAPRAHAPDADILIASDHAGVSLRAAVVAHLEARGLRVRDLGPWSTDSVDYPDYAQAVAKGVAEGRAPRGILFCGTGIGMSIAANKVPGIRAALVHDPLTAELAAQHNAANVLCMGARLVAEPYACYLVDRWLETAFEPRHQRRLDKIARIPDLPPLPDAPAEGPSDAEPPTS